VGWEAQDREPEGECAVSTVTDKKTPNVPASRLDNVQKKRGAREFEEKTGNDRTILGGRLEKGSRSRRVDN